MKKHGINRLAALLCAGLMLCVPVMPVSAADDIAHDPSRNVQAEGVGNPFGFGERIAPEGTSVTEIRALAHQMTVQQVKYALYKEIDEHWDLVSLRFGQTDREKVYALFLGIGSLESTLGGGNNPYGADLETQFNQGFPGNSGHAYGTLQTAVTAFYGPDTDYMQEDDVPELEWYALNEENFFDAIVSNHMGLRKIIHFIRQAMVDYDLTGWQVVRGALKGHNTGWANYTSENDGYYKTYPDEGAALAQWYYEEGHLYDNVFTWTQAEAASKQRAGNPWTDWWYDKEPSLAEVPENPHDTTTASTSATQDPPEPLLGDVDLNGKVALADAVLLGKFLCASADLTEEQGKQADINADRKLNAVDLSLLKRILLKG